MNEASLVLLHCSLIEGLGPAVVQKLLPGIPRDNASQLYDWSVSDLRERCDLSELIAHKLVQGLNDRLSLDRELGLLDRSGIRWISLFDPDYPELLKNIHRPPTGLYIQGQLPQDKKSIALVGARRAGEYARVAVRLLVGHLVQDGWTIVSGGARGVDTMAHEQTIANGGQTVVVLGSGLLRPYPTSNRKLFERVVESGGAIVSSFPLKVEALPHNFPARNRIIAGMSQGSVVVQAAQRSGALITAEFALQEGREVFAVPGPIDDPLSAGCHAIIQSGAKLVHRPQDICQELSAVSVCSFVEPEEAKPASNRKVKMVQTVIGAPDVDDSTLLGLCRQPTCVDDLVERLGKELVDVQQELLTLQLEGRVEQLPSGMWKVTR
ncbi:DNA-protecting protein DprA [bacterium]|jgi:DNA processing protein|nr:DNA-protecting protein DprA [bacterium]MBT5346015.1 DNA-protecting protein DprA [bacterium]